MARHLNVTLSNLLIPSVPSFHAVAKLTLDGSSCLPTQDHVNEDSECECY
eukprot:m.174679 g.174679  ORF g.174679 m.174679 type:complete len:50 (-) comp15410_c0_seq6:2846-2995(-)